MPETSARSKNYRNPLQAFWRLFRDERPDWLRSRPKDLDATPWPDGASLPRARVVAHNTRLIPASPEAIFEQLRRPTGWPSFYANAVDCTVQGSAGTLQAGTRFTWTTFGVQQRSQVLEYEEGCRITWDARSPGTYAIHRWLLHPEAGGTRVVTEEIQTGWVPSLLGPLLARALHAGHGMWLAGLAAVTAAPANASPPAADRPLARPVADMKPHYGVVVVGSGYGGGIAASRLARAGRDVCLLERGREIRPGEYPATAMHAEREIQIHSKDGHVGSELGLFDFHASEGLSALVGCGLGGTSLINANVALRAVPGVWQDPRWPREVRDDSAGLEAGYRHAEEMLRPTPYPEEAPALAKLDALKASAAALGRADRFYRPPLNVTFDDRLSPAGVSQSACNGCGDCVSGCNHRAKNTTLMNYLPDAANHGADLFTQCAVDRVEPGPGGKGWTVHFRALGEGRDRFHAPELFVTADVVVLAAGTLGSTEILLRSRAAGLNVSPRLGERVSSNGDVLAFGYAADRAVHGVGWGAHPPGRLPMVGPCITGIIDLRDTARVQDGFVIEDGSIPGALGPLLPEELGLASVGGRDTRSGQRVKEDALAAESVLLGPHHGAVDRSQTYLVMAHDGSPGSLGLDGNGRLRLDGGGVGREPVFRTIDETLRQCNAALSARHVRDPLWSKLLGQSLVTVHPLGGCAMAERAQDGVVDGRGRVFCGAEGTAVHDGLYVADGSVVPVSLGVNPLLTISALAERTVALLAQDRGWVIDYTLPSRTPEAPAPRTVGIRFTETMRGWFALGGPEDFESAAQQGREVGSAMEMTFTVEADDLEALIATPPHRTRLSGTVTAPALSPTPLVVHEGVMDQFTADPSNVEAKRMAYRANLQAGDGRAFFFDAFKLIHPANVVKSWAQTTTLYVTIREGTGPDGPIAGRGILRIKPLDFARQMTTMTVTNAPNELARLAGQARFGRYFAGALWPAYGGVFAHESFFDPGAPPRRKRPLRAPAPELHPFVASDGAALLLTRFRGGPKGPVLLVHGAGVSSGIFSTDLVETNLVEFLAASGYDVWLLDCRFSIALPTAATAPAGDIAAHVDVPEAIAAVCRLTGAPDVQVVAHCYGASVVAMAAAAGTTRIRCAVLSQVAAHFVAPLATDIKCGLHVPGLLEHFGLKSMTAYADEREGWIQGLLDDAMRLNPPGHGQACRDPVCHRATFLYGSLFEHAQLDDHLHANLHELFGPASLATFEHLARLVRAKQLVAADGADAYMPGLERLTFPLMLLHGENNRCWLPKSTQRTLDALVGLRGPAGLSRHVVPGYGHLDCMLGKNAARDVFPLIVAHLDQTALRNPAETVRSASNLPHVMPAPMA